MRPAYPGPPNGYRLSNPLLTSELAEAKVNLEQSLEKALCFTLMQDGWVNVKHEALINFLETGSGAGRAARHGRSRLCRRVDVCLVPHRWPALPALRARRRPPGAVVPGTESRVTGFFRTFRWPQRFGRPGPSRQRFGTPCAARNDLLPLLSSAVSGVTFRGGFS